MIRLCRDSDFEAIWEVVNDGANAYRGVIPADRWHNPYMTKDELADEIKSGVRFFAEVQCDGLVGIMGMQKVLDVTLIRHAYIRTAHQRQGIGGRLLLHLRTLTADPILIGTWPPPGPLTFTAGTAFASSPAPCKDELLNKYWSVPDRQIETSVVLADQPWRHAHEAATQSAETPGK